MYLLQSAKKLLVGSKDKLNVREHGRELRLGDDARVAYRHNECLFVEREHTSYGGRHKNVVVVVAVCG